MNDKFPVLKTYDMLTYSTFLFMKFSFVNQSFSSEAHIFVFKLQLKEMCLDQDKCNFPFTFEFDFDDSLIYQRSGAN